MFVQPFCVIFFLEVSSAPSHCCFNLLFTGIVWVGMKIPLDGNHANWYGHVAMVHGHDWRMLCSVCALGLRVAQPFPCNSHFLFLRFHRRRHTVVHWAGTGWFDFSTRWEPHKHARARGSGAWACLVHGLQCLYHGRGCRPALAMQVNFVLKDLLAPSHCCVTSLFTGMVRVGLKIPLNGNLANRYGHTDVVHGHVCCIFAVFVLNGMCVCPAIFLLFYYLC